GTELLALHFGARRAQVAAESLAAEPRRGVLGHPQGDVAADRLGPDLRTLRQRHAQVGVAGDRAGGQAPQALAAAVHVDVAGHGLGVPVAVEAAGEADIAADGLRMRLGGIERQPQVAADALHVRAARGRGHGDVAADGIDLELARGHPVHVHVRRDRLDLEAGLQRHHQAQVGRSGAVAAPGADLPGVLHLDVEVAAVAFDHQFLDAIAEAAGDLHFVAIPGAHLDAALEVVHG